MHVYEYILCLFNLHMVVNVYDRLAVTVLKDGEVVGHVPQTLSKVTSFFLRDNGNFVFCDVTGERLNCGVQLGVEVSCVYKYYGRQTHIDKLKKLVVNVEH